VIAALIGTNLFIESVSSIDTQMFAALRDRCLSARRQWQDFQIRIRGFVGGADVVGD
jgi:hypothetical protein